jgi:hypothetical protein
MVHPLSVVRLYGVRMPLASKNTREKSYTTALDNATNDSQGKRASCASEMRMVERDIIGIECTYLIVPPDSTYNVPCHPVSLSHPGAIRLERASFCRDLSAREPALVYISEDILL